MQNYGYLEEYGFHSNTSSSPMISESSVRQGIRSLQQFAGIPETGTLDEGTKKV